jgi:predicted transcriptional regulator
MKKAGEKKIDARILKIADKLRKMRIEKGFTSYEHFAWDNEIGRQQYWRIEKGKNFTMQTLLKILDIHKITMEEFFKGID